MKVSVANSSIHGTSYSYIAVQAAYLATYFPVVYWNTAYLRVISGLEEEDSTNYVKIAAGVGEVISHGITVKPIDVNRSNYLFEPDEENNAILFGLKAISNVGGEVIQELVKNRPYASVEDVEKKVSSINKTGIIALIKGGGFDSMGDRVEIMKQYVSKISEPKKRLTLQNFKGLLDKNLWPQDLDYYRRLFNFNKALKTYKKAGNYYIINYQFYDFYEEFFDVDLLEPVEGTLGIPTTTWQKLYTKGMEPAKKYIQENQEELLKKFNNLLFEETWNKYASGTVSSWEMDSLGYYYHEHELANVRQDWYNIIPYESLPSEPKVSYTFRRNGRDCPIYETYKIMGTVVGKNNTKSSINILTVDSGVVTVKFNIDYFAQYNRRISAEVDGVNKIVEKGYFVKGQKLVINGYRRGDTFIAKRYKKTKGHCLYRIDKIYEDGRMELVNTRGGE